MFVNISGVNYCLGLDVTPAEKMVAIILAIGSFDGETRSTGDVMVKAGMSKVTFVQALDGLIKKGIVHPIKRGLYRMDIVDTCKAWVNLEYFKYCLAMDIGFKEKLTMISIAKHIAEGKDYCWPKIETISNLVGVAVRAVQRTVAKLIELGILSRMKEAGRWIFKVIKDTPSTILMANSGLIMTGQTIQSAPSNKYKEEKKEFNKGGIAPTQLTEAEKDKLPVKSKVGGSAAAALQKVAAKVHTYKANPVGLGYLWRSTLPKVLELDNMQQANLTSKQVVMLKHFLRCSTSYNVDVQEVLLHVLWNWGMYASSVQIKKDLKSVPGIPVVEWVVKHADTIFQSYLEFQSETKAVKEVIPSDSNTVQLIAPKKGMSLQELMDKYAGGDDE